MPEASFAVTPCVAVEKSRAPRWRRPAVLSFDVSRSAYSAPVALEHPVLAVPAAVIFVLRKPRYLVLMALA